MCVVKIRDLDPRDEAGLQRWVAAHCRAVEAKTRAFLAEAGLPSREGLFTTLHRSFADLGGVELELPPRTPDGARRFGKDRSS